MQIDYRIFVDNALEPLHRQKFFRNMIALFQLEKPSNTVSQWANQFLYMIILEVLDFLMTPISIPLLTILSQDEQK